MQDHQPTTLPAQQTQSQIALFEPANVQSFSALARQSFSENTASRDRCLSAGQDLLDRAQLYGMTAELDQAIAHYIEKAKATLRKINGKRAPITQAFDLVRRAFTAIENDVNPDKDGSIPARLQALRNKYAAEMREAEEQRRRLEAERIARESAKAAYRAAAEEDYKTQFNALVNRQINALADIDKATTLDSIAATEDALRQFPAELPKQWLEEVACAAYRPACLAPEECRAIAAAAIAALAERFTTQYAFEVGATRDDMLARLPSKEAELRRMAQASAEEAARIKAMMEAKEREEAARKEAERRRREEEEKAAAQLAAQKKEMDSLFGLPAAAADAAYQPKTQVKKKAVVETADDIMAIVAFWWSQEGCNRPIDELRKEFKKQINFANAAANAKAGPMLITNVRYEDEVKAK